MNKNLLELALRAHVVSVNDPKYWNKTQRQPESKWPGYVLIFDTETTTDTTQRLTFGSYRYCRWTTSNELDCVEEGIFYADDLAATDPNGFATLKQYSQSRPALVAGTRRKELRFLSRREFLEQVFWKSAYKARAMVVGFNLPFDLTRLAIACAKGRGKYLGGFSLTLFDYLDTKTGRYREDRHRPRIRIKHINNKLAFMGFGQRREQDPGERAEGEPAFQGNFLDLRTLAFALTNKGFALEKACLEFAVEHPKTPAKEHGKITDEYIDYNRGDVRASHELLVKLRAEFDQHPVELIAIKGYSPASLSKSYLRMMNLAPPAKQFSAIPPRILGYTMSAYFGGRAECRVRKAIAPVVCTDFASMYPTANTHLGLWSFLTAQRIEIVDATDEVRQLLNSVNSERCFRPAFWRKFTFFALVEPRGDALPVRARYSGDAFTIGINSLTCDKPLWFAGPDIVASTLLAGKPPKVLRAFKLVPSGCQKQLRPVSLSGKIVIDPRRGDFFKTVVEERKRLAFRDDLSDNEKTRLDEFLKVLANAGSYGIFAELIRQELPAKQREALRVYGLDAPFLVRTNRPERPGVFCFPPIAALITSGARLMLALLEKCVIDAGGSYVFCDTDSMAIVATRDGGLVKCGDSTIKALTWKQTDAIVTRFESLNPYARDAVPGSILKIENINFKNGKHDQLFAYSISSKRYVLFRFTATGEPIIEKPLEHGLGHLLNPIDPNAEDPDWIARIWELILREELGLPVVYPEWFDRPAISRLTITSHELLKPFVSGRRRKSYRDLEKPGNFLLTAHVAKLGHPAGVDPKKFQLVLPYGQEPGQWLKQKWTDVHSGKSFAVTTKLAPQPGMVRIKSIRDVYEEYKHHPEPKSADSNGRQSNQQTRGLLGRLAVEAVSLTYVGKESNMLDDVENEVIHDWDDVQQEYRDEDADLLNAVLRKLPADELARAAKISTRAIRAIRNGHSRPTARTRELLMRAAKRLTGRE